MSKFAMTGNIDPMATNLLKLKTQLANSLLSTRTKQFDRHALDSLLLKRFFIAPSFAIYGGIAGLYDYGPAGTALQNNILAVWRQHFVLEEDMLEIECTALTPEVVLKTSGHVDRFADYMTTDSITGDIFRADHLINSILTARLALFDSQETKKKTLDNSQGVTLGTALDSQVTKKKEYELILETLDNYQGDALGQLIKDHNICAPLTGNPLTKPILFNLMFDTQIGPTGQFKGFLRPETAQGHFLNFKRLLEYNNDQMPFASASIGKSFRNELSPRQGLLRVREFTMAEIEHFVHKDRKDHPRFNEVSTLLMPLYSKQAQLLASGPSLIKLGEAVSSKLINNQTLGYYLARIYKFLLKIGIDESKIRFRQHMDNELAHYADDCWDADIKTSYGWIECVGCADRSAFDLTAHSQQTGERLVARDVLAEPITSTKLVLEIAKTKFGPAFKKNARFVQGYLSTIVSQGDLADFKAKLDVGDGMIKVIGTDGNEYLLTSEMISVISKTETVHVVEYTPNVIEPSFGIGRIMYSLLEHSYYTRENDDQRAVLKFPAMIAPTKALVVPLSNHPDFKPLIKDIGSINLLVARLRRSGISNKVDNSSGSIGRRYARNDEVGTPFGITVDFESLKDGSVTLRERDSTSQIRGSLDEIVGVCCDLVHGRVEWSLILKKYGEFVSNDN